MSLLHTLRKRSRILFGVFIVGAGGYALWAYLGPSDYRATATVQYFRSSPLGVSSSANSSAESDILVGVRKMESPVVTEQVAADINKTMGKEFMAPLSGWGAPKTVGEALAMRRTVQMVPDSTMIEVSFTHPNPEIAAKTADLYAEQFIALSKAANEEQIAKMRAGLEAPADKQKLIVDDVQGRMNTLIAKYGLANLDADTDTVYLAAVQEMQKNLATDKAKMEATLLRWRQIQQQADAGKPLWELADIASQTTVAGLLKTYTEAINQVNVVMSRGYIDGSNEVAFARQRVAATGDELAAAAASAARVFGNEALTAQANYEQAVKRLADKQVESQAFAQVHTAYNNMRKERDLAQNLYQTQMFAAQKQETEFNLSLPQFTLLQPAAVPLHKDVPAWRPVLWTSLGVGAGCGLLAYIGLAIFRPVPSAEREEYERRRKRHSHFDPRERRSSRRRHSSSSSSSSSSS